MEDTCYPFKDEIEEMPVLPKYSQARRNRPINIKKKHARTLQPGELSRQDAFNEALHLEAQITQYRGS